MYEAKSDFQEKINSASKDMLDALSFPNFIKFVQEDLGYPLEKHVYATADGYLNTCFRIPGMKNQTV